jgi:predicted metal-dependent hydrolase
VSSDTAVKISMYAIYYAHKIKDNELMDTIAKEQSKRSYNGFIILTAYYTMNKYSKTNLLLFKNKWAEENVQKRIDEKDEILEGTNDNIKGLFNLMKRKCGDYLYKANLIWENLIDSKQHDADKWFLQYSKVSREFYNEN